LVSFAFVALALCVASSWLVGCGDEEGCDFEGKHYSVGEKFDCDCACRVCQEDGTIATPLVWCTAGAPNK
jgi:hypothetical protein